MISFFQESYRAFHPDLTLVQKYLKTFYIGDVITDTNQTTYCSKEDQTLKDEFEQLRQKAISQVIFGEFKLY